MVNITFAEMSVKSELAESDPSLDIKTENVVPDSKVSKMKNTSCVKNDFFGVNLNIKTEPGLESDVNINNHVTSVGTDVEAMRPTDVFTGLKSPETAHQEPLSSTQTHTRVDLAPQFSEPENKIKTELRIESGETVSPCESTIYCIKSEPLDCFEDPNSGHTTAQPKLIVKLKRKTKTCPQLPKGHRNTKLKTKSDKTHDNAGDTAGDVEPGLIVKCEPLSNDCAYSTMDFEAVSESPPRPCKSKKKKTVHICSHCQQRCCSRSTLKRHYSRKHDSESLPFPCQECDAMFSRLLQLRAHQRRHRGLEKVFPCQQCEVVFTRACHLKVHMRKHTGERPFSCPDCHATFRSTSNLNRHRKKHSGERVYVCTVCQASFYQSSHLVSHVRKHTGERPFTCSHCQATFTQLTHLHRHMARHTGHKRYPCAQCTLAFVEAYGLKKHVERMHGKKAEAESKGKGKGKGKQFKRRRACAQKEKKLNLKTEKLCKVSVS